MAIANNELRTLCEWGADVEGFSYLEACLGLLDQIDKLEQERDLARAAVEVEAEPYADELEDLARLFGHDVELTIHYSTDRRRETWYRLEAGHHRTGLLKNFTFESARRELLAMFAESVERSGEPDIEAIRKEIAEPSDKVQFTAEMAGIIEKELGEPPGEIDVAAIAAAMSAPFVRE